MASDATLNPHLQKGERLLWHGQPTLQWFQPIDKVLVPLTLVFALANLGFLLVFLGSATQDVPWPMYLFMGFFTALMLFVVFGRFLVRRRIMRATHYGITNQRVIAVHTGKTDTVRSRPRGSVQVVELVQRGDTGDVFFEPGGDTIGSVFERLDPAAALGFYTFPKDGRGFRNIDNPQEVAAMVAELAP